MSPVRRRIAKLLARGAASDGKLSAGMCRERAANPTRLWQFLQHDGVEPTNSASERPLRHAVIGRKLSFGAQRPAGSRFVSTMLTVVASCRQQGRTVCNGLVQTIQGAPRRKTRAVAAARGATGCMHPSPAAGSAMHATGRVEGSRALLMTGRTQLQRISAMSDASWSAMRTGRESAVPFSAGGASERLSGCTIIKSAGEPV
ncbi:MAG: transposase [Pirellulales bacterium]|nr:transposase [Pirellulales bacterium]